MLHATIHVAMPQASSSRNRSHELVDSRYRSSAAYEGNAATTSALSLLEGIARGLRDADIDNIISLRIDQTQVYIDTRDEPHDLDEMLDAAQSSPALDQPYDEIHMVASHEADGLRVMLDLTVEEQTLRRQGSFGITLSGRVLEMQIIPGEGAQAYAERLREWAADSSNIERYRAAMDRLVARLSQMLTSALPGAEVSSEETQVRLVRPTPQQLGQMRHLTFGEDQRSSQFRAVRPDLQEQQKRRARRSRQPETTHYVVEDDEELPRPERRSRRSRRDRDRSDRDRRRSGSDRDRGRRSGRSSSGGRNSSGRGQKRADNRRSSRRADKRANRRKRSPRRQQHRYVDVYNTYYHDPYWDFATYVLLDAMLFHHAWHLPYVHIYDPWGTMLGAGLYVEDFLHGDPLIGFGGALSFGHDGGLMFADNIPDIDLYDDGYYGDYGFDDGYGAHGYDDASYDDYGDGGDYGYDDAGYDDAGYDDAGYYDDDDDGHGGCSSSCSASGSSCSSCST